MQKKNNRIPFSPVFRKAVEPMSVFAIGAFAYLFMELFWRGHSHITMFFAGGICFLLIYLGEKRLDGYGTFTRCVLYAYLITAVELVFGVVFNLLLGWDVWDYSDRTLNLWGQICPLFFFLWIGVSYLAIRLCRPLRRHFDKVRQKIS